eukprot:TRINITY_DN7908_c0_g2_i1.p1 TRINITY_DN7908_c0_g2~~TRINITY_DN7908_c0_g2_i1.p1  ORF type:complete len:102 (-),score=45.84 TRINITY_DN7908_c0_g2_i1:130-435(-)
MATTANSNELSKTTKENIKKIGFQVFDEIVKSECSLIRGSAIREETFKSAKIFASQEIKIVSTNEKLKQLKREVKQQEEIYQRIKTSLLELNNICEELQVK